MALLFIGNLMVAGIADHLKRRVFLLFLPKKNGETRNRETCALFVFSLSSTVPLLIGVHCALPLPTGYYFIYCINLIFDIIFLI